MKNMQKSPILFLNCLLLWRDFGAIPTILPAKNAVLSWKNKPKRANESWTLEIKQKFSKKTLFFFAIDGGIGSVS
jgi:hypothetical protein